MLNQLLLIFQRFLVNMIGLGIMGMVPIRNFPFCRFGSLAQNDTPDPSKLEINKNVDEKYVENEEEEDYETDNDEGEEEEVKLRNKNLSVEMRALSASLSDLRAPRPRPISEIGPLRRPTKPRRRLLFRRKYMESLCFTNKCSNRSGMNSTG